MENGEFVFVKDTGNYVPLLQIVDGLNITVRKDILEKILRHPTLQSQFALHIKQLDQDWYKLYFEKLDNC